MTDPSNWQARGGPHVPPIAICGMGLRLPGSVSSPPALFDFLVNKRDARSRTGTSRTARYNVDAFRGAPGKPCVMPMDHGYWLQDVDLAEFDASMFSLTEAEIEKLDPQQRLLLEVVYVSCLSALIHSRRRDMLDAHDRAKRAAKHNRRRLRTPA